MSKIVIYGAGKRGRTLYAFLKRHGTIISYFVDRNYAEIKQIDSIPVYGYDYLYKNKNDTRVYICVRNINDYNDVRQQMLNDGICVSEDYKDVYYGNITENNRNYIAEFHELGMDYYFDDAEKWVDYFWTDDSPYYKMFQKLNLDHVVEVACGHGRHIEKYKDRSVTIIGVDILQKNIDFCRKRFKDDINVSFIKNNGFDLEGIPDESQTAVFSYDSFVHFELIDIFSYLKEMNRVLKPGGRILIHHSNNTEDYRITFESAIHGRNFMSKQVFAHLCDRSGFIVKEQLIVDWDEVKDLDCLTLAEKKLEV